MGLSSFKLLAHTLKQIKSCPSIAKNNCRKYILYSLYKRKIILEILCIKTEIQALLKSVGIQGMLLPCLPGLCHRLLCRFGQVSIKAIAAS